MSKLEDYLNEEEELPAALGEIDLLAEKLADNRIITLYKLDSKGKQRQWSISAVEEDGNGVIRITTGLVDGKKVEQPIVITEGKNLGKNNATTPYTQALAEAKARIEQQIRAGYVRNLEDVKASGTLGSGVMSPLLAQKYSPDGSQKSSKTLDQMKIRDQDIFISRKLDGVRGLIVVNPEGAILYTRKGDKATVQPRHILDEIYLTYTKLGATAEIVFDGELFVDPTEMAFNELNGHLKRKDSVDEEQVRKIKYYLYDVMLNVPYDARYDYIKNFAQNTVHTVLVESYLIKATEENIQKYLEQFLAENFEGAMLRIPNKGYENKRSWQLVKVKLFQDEEFKILGLEPDTMGRLGYFIMEMNEPTVDRDGNVVTAFKAGCTGIDHATGKKMLTNKQDYIGKMATIEYFGKDIRPRFPKFKAVRED